MNQDLRYRRVREKSRPLYERVVIGATMIALNQYKNLNHGEQIKLAAEIEGFCMELVFDLLAEKEGPVCVVRRLLARVDGDKPLPQPTEEADER